MPRKKLGILLKVNMKKSIRQAVTVEQLKRVLNSLKTEVKKKMDKTKTGYKRVKLSAWEKDFVSILEKFENPTKFVKKYKRP